MRRRMVVGAALVDDLQRPTRLLAARRTEPAHLAGGWELPGGKVDPGEGLQEALHREIREELGVRIALGDLIPGPLVDGLPAPSWPLGDTYALVVHLAVVTAGVPAPLEDHDALRWLGPGELEAVPWLPDDLPVVRVVGARMTSRPG